jgi:hypothetical protein
MSESGQYISRETEGKTWCCEQQSGWAWREENTRIPYQSEMTTDVAREILKDGTCDLTPFDESCALHLPMLEALGSFLREHGLPWSGEHPFT